MSTTTTSLADLAERAARAAAAELTQRFGHSPSGISAKSSTTDLVSDADRAAEAASVGVIVAERPDDGIVAEEGTGQPGTSGIEWLLDPLDGTTNYLWGIPHWCVSVAAQGADGLLAGVVHDPLRGETFTATREGGAWAGTRRLRIQDERSLGEALVGTGFNYSADERERQATRLVGILPAVRDVRRLGAAALDLSWAAAGRLDAYFETGLQPWDRAAGELIVIEAGGLVVDLPGRGGGPAGVIAGAPALVRELLQLLELAG